MDLRLLLVRLPPYREVRGDRLLFLSFFSIAYLNFLWLFFSFIILFYKIDFTTASAIRLNFSYFLLLDRKNTEGRSQISSCLKSKL